MRYLIGLAAFCVLGVSLLWSLSSRTPDGPEKLACATAIERDERFELDVTAAVDLINPILAAEHRLYVLTEENQHQEPPQPIPVYSGRASVTGNMLVQVPVNCPLVVFNAREFYNGLEQAFGQDVSEDNIHKMLAFLLLHEIGHIKHKHYGQFLPAGSTTNTNLTNTFSKELESEADDFVVDVLGARIKGEEDDPVFTAHQLMNFIGYLSFVISGRNSIDCFGCRPLGSKDIFWDHSQTHENLELRLLKISNSLYPTEQSSQMLRDFEDNRINSGRPRVWYVDPQLTPTDDLDREPPGYGLGLDLDLDSAPELEDIMKELQDTEDENSE